MNKNDLFKLGRYFELIEEYDVMIHYYIKGISLGDNRAMFCLGRYYQKINNFDNMLKYYIMAIEFKSDLAMNALANYFGKNSKYDLFKKYHLMAIELNNKDSMNELAFYYQIKEKDIETMKKYYIMGAKLNYAPCICNLGRYYQSLGKYTNAIMLYKLAIKYNSQLALKNLNNLLKKKPTLNVFYNNIRIEFTSIDQLIFLLSDSNNFMNIYDNNLITTTLSDETNISVI